MLGAIARRGTPIAALLAAATSCGPSTVTVDPTVDLDDSPPAEVLGLPDISGMARWGDDAWLVVHDARDPALRRASVIWVGSAAPPRAVMVEIDDASLPDGALLDLESLAALPGSPSEFLALESGVEIAGRPRRRLLVRLGLDVVAGQPTTLRVLAFTDVLPATAALGNCEGLACWVHEGEFRLLIADRGRKDGRRAQGRRSEGRAATVAGTLVSTAAELRFDPLPESAQRTIVVPLPSSGPWRVCSDLHLDDAGVLWGACAQDLGATGPFRSKVYRTGELDGETGWLRLRPATIEHDIDGLKVEALAACALPHAAMCFATDDELYGGVWRPLRDAGGGRR